METTILDLDMRINKLKQEQNFNECLTLIEKTIVLKSEMYGKRSREVFNYIKL
jgi:hypothetical protein